MSNLEEVYRSKETSQLLELVEESHHLEDHAIVSLIKELESRGVTDAKQKIDNHINSYRESEYQKQSEMSLIGRNELAGKILKHIKAGLSEEKIAQILEEEYVGYYRFKTDFRDDWLQMIRVCYTSLDKDLGFKGDPYKSVVKSFNLSEADQEELIRFSIKKRKPLIIFEMVVLIIVASFIIITSIDEGAMWPLAGGIGLLLFSAFLYWWNFKVKVLKPIDLESLKDA